MKKLLLLTFFLLPILSCSDENLSEQQEYCEEQALDILKSYMDCSDIVFSELYRADIPKDSLDTYKMLVWAQELYNRYENLYGTSAGHEIDGWDYSTIIRMRDGTKNNASELDKIYTKRNYVIKCSFIDNSYGDDISRKREVLFVFNKNYKYIDRQVVSSKLIE